MLMTDIVRQVQRRFGDGIGSVITNADVIDWVNEGIIEINKEAGVNVLEQTVTIANFIAAGYEFSLNNAVMLEYVKLDERFLDVKNYRLIGDDKRKMDATGWPQYYFLINQGGDSTVPQVVNHNTYGLYPTPDSSMGASTLKISYYVLPAPITTTVGAGSAIELPVQFHPDLVNFCIMRAHERNKDWQGMNVAQQQFNLGLASRINTPSQVETSLPVIEDVIGY